jgi:hypothetical protein
MTHAGNSAPRVDRLTLVSIAVVAYALANLVHEGLGHGGTCIALGGHLLAFSAVHAQCDVASGVASGAVMAAGTVANLLAGAVALLILRRWTSLAVSGRVFLWLFMTVSFLQGTGYWLFSGLANVGDWAQLVAGIEPRWPYRLALAVAGVAGYRAAIGLGLRILNPFAGGGPGRLERARTLAMVPYVAGGVLYLAAGALNPVSPRLVVVSAAAASLGGTSALAWMTRLLVKPAYRPSPDDGCVIERSPGWVVAGCVAGAVFVGLLGPGLRF